ncbi:MAG: hypothetical protein ACI965_002374 [Paraglaciecola sp.]
MAKSVKYLVKFAKYNPYPYFFTGKLLIIMELNVGQLFAKQLIYEYTFIHHILNRRGSIMNMTAIAIVALVCWAIVALVNGPRAKKKDNKETQVSDQSAQELAALKERIETLEKIVTDEKYDLNRQFDDLKKDKVA